MKNTLLSQALESLETPVPSALPAAAPAAAPAQASTPTVPVTSVNKPMISRENNDEAVEKKIDQLSRNQVGMNAPLSTIFTRALNIAMAKKDVVTGQYEGTKPAAQTQELAVAQESQAQDVYISLANRRLVADALSVDRIDPTEPDKPEIPDTLETGGSGTRLQATATNEEVIRFFNDQSLDDISPEFCFYQKVGERTDGVGERFWDQSRMIMLNEKGGEGTYVVESIEIVVTTRKVEVTDE